MKIRCASCGADFPLERDTSFQECPFCRSHLFLDRARTFLRFALRPLLDPSRARLSLLAALKRMELPLLPILEVRPRWIPFWSQRGRESEGAVPALSPRPPWLRGYHLPPAEARVAGGEEAAFAPLEGVEEVSSGWMGEGQAGEYRLFLVPFYRVALGGGEEPYVAWVEAVSGAVRFERSPLPLTASVSRRFWSAMVGLFTLFLAESLLLPAGLALAAVLLSALACLPVLRKVAGVD
ncbi:MAG: hypothetical protein ACP5VN_00390 [Acidobacteriota bacterium]